VYFLFSFTHQTVLTSSIQPFNLWLLECLTNSHLIMIQTWIQDSSTRAASGHYDIVRRSHPRPISQYMITNCKPTYHSHYSPTSHRTVIASGQLPDDAGVALGCLPVNHSDTMRIVQVPEPQCAVNWAADDAPVVKLQTRDCVLVAMKSLQTFSTERPHLEFEVFTNTASHNTFTNTLSAITSFFKIQLEHT